MKTQTRKRVEKPIKTVFCIARTGAVGGVDWFSTPEARSNAERFEGDVLFDLDVDVGLSPAEITKAADNMAYNEQWLEEGSGCRRVAEAGKLAEKRIHAIFQPQAWKDDCVIEIDGRREVDVTGKVLRLTLADLIGLEDDSYETDDLVDLKELGHSGPFYVSVKDQVAEFFGVNDLSEVTQAMLDEARKLAAQPEDLTVSRPRAATTPRAAAEPLTIAYMGYGFSEFCNQYHAAHGAHPAFDGELEALSQVIEHALLADRVGDYFDQLEGHPGVFAYDVAQPLGHALAQAAMQRQDLDYACVSEVLRSLMLSAGYPGEDLDGAFRQLELDA